MAKDKEFDVGDRVQITQGSENWAPEMNAYVGKIATIKRVIYNDSYDDYIYKIELDREEWNWWPSKGHFIHAPQHGIDQKDELLYRAEQMFPVGTKFCPAHQVDEREIREGTHCIITDDTSFKFDDNGNIFAIANDRRWFLSEDTKYGNTCYDRIVYLARNKKWAHIYSSVGKEEPKEDNAPIPANELLVIEAKKRYPIGTCFHPAHANTDAEYCIITDDTEIVCLRDGNIYATIHSGSNWDNTGNHKYGNTTLNRTLYYKPIAKWADITEEKFEEGDIVMITQGRENWANEMDEYVGKLAVLTSAPKDSGYFSIDLDKGYWSWSNKDGHFRRLTPDELTIPAEFKTEFKYKVGDKLYLKESHNAVSPQGVTVASRETRKGKPHYKLKGWAGMFPEYLLEPTVEESSPSIDLLATAHMKYPVGTKYKCAAGGSIVYTVEKQSFSLHDANTVYGNPGHGCLYKNGEWAEIVGMVRSVSHKFKVGDWVVANHETDGKYAITTEGWGGQVTRIREKDGYIDVQGKYNKDNGEFCQLDPECFDLVTEDYLRSKSTYVTLSSDYILQEEFDRVTASIGEHYDKVSSRMYAEPVNESRVTVKKVSFKRI